MNTILEKAKNIALVIFDVDGVLTDGSLYFGDDGQEYKAFNSKDGHGMKLLQQSGIKVAIITARSSNVVKHRMQNLGIEEVHQGCQNKVSAYYKILEKLQLPKENTCYVGDDIIDLPVMIQVGLAVAVEDAHPLVKKHAHWQTQNKGGKGAAREVCELILQAQGKLAAIYEKYLNVE